MTRSRFDIEREPLARIVAGRDRYEDNWRHYNEVADRILIEFLPGHDERVRADLWDSGWARAMIDQVRVETLNAAAADFASAARAGIEPELNMLAAKLLSDRAARSAPETEQTAIREAGKR